MSYGDDRRRRRRDDSPLDSYQEEEIIAARSGPKGSKPKGTLIPRPRDGSESSVEEIRRDFPPRGHSYDRRRDYPPRRSKSARESGRGSRYNDEYDDDYYDDRDRRRDKRRKRRDYSSSDSSRSPPPRRDRERRKSVPEQALEALGIGGAGGAALAAVMGGKSKDKDKDRKSSSRRDGRSRRYSSSSSSSSSRSRSRTRRKGNTDPREKLIQAAKAAAIAGGAEAWRMRNEPGDWKGPKGRRVLTAAVGAAGVDGLLDKDPDKKGTRHTIQSAMAGLAGNRVINGSRNEERSRSRSRGRYRDDSRGDGGSGGGGLASLGGATALAGLAAKAFNSARSKSRGRGRRDYSSSSDDSRSYRGSGRRAKSVSDYMRSGLGKLGIGNNTVKRDTIDRGSLSPPRTRGMSNGAIYPTAATATGAAAASRPRGGGIGGSTNRSTSSDTSDTISSTEEETERKHLGRKQLITAGLASVATIHAAHDVYSSYEKSKELDEDVAEGEISVKDARRKKKKARMRQLASIGVAALGVKGAYSEWKEVQESRHEKVEFDEKMKQRHERRALRSQGYGPSMASTEAGSTVHDSASTYNASNPPPAPTQYRSTAPPSHYYHEDGRDHYGGSQPYPPNPGPNAYYPDAAEPRYDDGNPYQAPPEHRVPNMGPPPGYQ